MNRLPFHWVGIGLGAGSWIQNLTLLNRAPRWMKILVAVFSNLAATYFNQKLYSCLQATRAEELTC